MAFSWKNLFGMKSQAAVDDPTIAGLQHPTAVLVDAATGQPPVGGQAVNPCPYLGDQTGDSQAFTSGAASTAKALPANTTRLSIWVDAPAAIRLGNGSVAATAASWPLAPNTPYEFSVRAAEGYISIWGLGQNGTARWGRVDAA